MTHKGLTVDEARALLGSLGYTCVKTSAGWIPLEAWNPYGNAPSVRLTLDQEQHRLVDAVTYPLDNPRGVAMGIWPVRKD